MRLLDKLKQTAQDAANSVADSATKVKEKATDIVSVATDKETYAKIGQTLHRLLIVISTTPIIPMSRN